MSTDPPPEPTAPVDGLPVTGEPAADAATTPDAATPEASARETPPRRRWALRRRTAAGPAGDEAVPEAGTPPPAADGDAPAEAAADPVPSEGARRLRRDRRRLITRREEAVYHLGGLAFELYRRDMLREEVMRRRAGEVAEIDDTVRDIDVRLGEIDRERRERRRREPADPSAGCCLTCRTPFRADARYCWQCGAQLVPPSMGDEQVTAVITTRPEGP